MGVPCESADTRNAIVRPEERRLFYDQRRRVIKKERQRISVGVARAPSRTGVSRHLGAGRIPFESAYCTIREANDEVGARPLLTVFSLYWACCEGREQQSQSRVL